MTTARELANTVPNLEFTPNPLIPAAYTGALVEEVKNAAEAIQHIRLQLTNVKVVIADADAYGGTLLGYLPDKNMVFIGGEANLTWSKDGAGILTAENPKLAFGRAAASNATLASTMSNMINGGAAAGTAIGTGLTGTWQYHSADNVTAPPYLACADSATSPIYLNASVNPTGDGYLLISGTVDLYFIDLGNETS